MQSLVLALKNMKQKAKVVVDSIQPLLEVSLKIAEKVGNDQIQISVARTKDIINQLKSLRNELSKQTQKVIENKYLDVKFASFL
jgi:phage gp29-like protein